MRFTGPMWLEVGSADEVRGTRFIARVAELLALDARRNELDGEELARWLDLDDSLRRSADDPRVAPRVVLGLPARLILPATGDEAPAWISDLSGSGAFVETRLTVDSGARVIVRIGPGRAGYEWRLPADVVRVESQRGSGVGVRWVGAPLVLHHAGLRPTASAAPEGGR